MNDIVVKTLPQFLTCVSFVGAIVFVAIYDRKARWRESAVGRHMMYFGLMMVLVLGLGIARIFWSEAVWFAYSRVGAFAIMTALIWQRVYLLVVSLRKGSLHARKGVSGDENRPDPERI